MMKIFEEAARCMLCENPSCSNACPDNFDPARMIRAVRFENSSSAADFINSTACLNCSGECEKSCIHYDKPLRIKEMISLLPTPEPGEAPSLEIDFLGIHCENPFFLSSSIVAGNYEMCARALRAGWAGVVFKTIGFIRPEEVSPRFDATTKEGTPFIGFKNLEQISDHTLNENLDALKRLKKDFPTKVIVASIMGEDEREWGELARLVTKTGADMIECNFSCPHMSEHGLGSDVGTNPELVAKYSRAVKANTDLPVLAKMTPNIGNMEIPAIAAVKAGVDGLAAINTIKSISGFDLERMAPKMCVNDYSSVSGYSGKAVKPIALRFICDLAKCEKLSGVPISGMGGIETWHDAAEFLALGCSNIQITTAVMEYGYRIIDDLIKGLADFMKRHSIKKVADLVGTELKTIVQTDKLDRKTVIYPKFDLQKCIGCGRCYISCNDAGHQAISFTLPGGKPVFNLKKCVGCHLCTLVCPVSCIGMSRRVNKPLG